MATRREIGEMLDSLRKQEGGTHYRSYAIQPVEYIVANGIGFLAGNVIKYAMRQGKKEGSNDAGKALHYKQKLNEVAWLQHLNRGKVRTPE